MLSQDPYQSRALISPAILARCEPVVYDREQGPEPAALNAAQRDAYRENGFLLLPELFSKARSRRPVR